MDDNGKDKKKQDTQDDRENQKTEIIIPGDKLGVTREQFLGLVARMPIGGVGKIQAQESP